MATELTWHQRNAQATHRFIATQDWDGFERLECTRCGLNVPADQDDYPLSCAMADRVRSTDRPAGVTELIAGAQAQAAWSAGFERARSMVRELELYGTSSSNVMVPDPLSGEWAGESMSEIYASITGRDLADEPDYANAILHEYELGFDAGWY
jgi:hypothetical protein